VKIAVAGKGGVGKTLVAATLADYFSTRGLRVLAVDADPTPSLAYVLGIPKEMIAGIIPISDRDDLIRSKTDSGVPGVYRLNFSVGDIIQNYSVMAPDDANLIVMGTVKSAGEGCTCPQNAVLKALMRHVIVQRDEMIVLDMEAGLEHMGRGTAERVDLMIVVSEAGHRSLEVASRLIELAHELGLRHILVGNKIRNESDGQALRQCASRCETEVGALVPYDETVEQFETEGISPLMCGERSNAIATIRRFAEWVLEMDLVA